MRKRYLLLLPLLVLALITFGRTDDNKKKAGDVITKTVSVCRGDRVTVHYGRIDPNDMLRLVVTPSCCEKITGEVVDPDDMGWVGGSGEAVNKLEFTTRPSEYKTGTHIGTFRGDVICDREGGDGGGGGEGETIVTEEPEGWRIDAISTVRKKPKKNCVINTATDCIGGDQVLVSASLLNPPPLCQITLTKDGKVIGGGNGMAFGLTSDKKDHEITVETCCGEEKIKIEKGMCPDDGEDDEKCRLTLTSDPKKACLGDTVELSAEIESSGDVKTAGCRIKFGREEGSLNIVNGKRIQDGPEATLEVKPETPEEVTYEAEIIVPEGPDVEEECECGAGPAREDVRVHKPVLTLNGETNFSPVQDDNNDPDRPKIKPKHRPRVCRHGKIAFGVSCAPKDGYDWRISGPQNKNGTFTPGNTTAELKLEKPGTYTLQVRDGGFEGQDNLVKRKLTFNVVALKKIISKDPSPDYIPANKRLDVAGFPPAVTLLKTNQKLKVRGKTTPPKPAGKGLVSWAGDLGKNAPNRIFSYTHLLEYEKEGLKPVLFNCANAKKEFRAMFLDVLRADLTVVPEDEEQIYEETFDSKERRGPRKEFLFHEGIEGRGTDRMFRRKPNGAKRKRTFVHNVTIQAQPKDEESPNPEVARNLKLKEIRLEANKPLKNKKDEVLFDVEPENDGRTVPLNGVPYRVRISDGKRKVTLEGKKLAGKGKGKVTLKRMMFKNIQVTTRSNTRFNLDVDSEAEVQFKNRFNRKFKLCGGFDKGIKTKEDRKVKKPLTEVFPVGLYIVRVPQFVFSDSDYWVPIYARIEGLPTQEKSGLSKEVRVENPNVFLYEDGDRIEDFRGGFPHVGLGIGNGTAEGAKPVFEDKKEATIADEQRKKNGTFFFTTFVDNKTASKDMEFSKLNHLKTPAKKIEIPYYKIQNMTLKIKNVEVKTGVFRDIELEDLDTSIEPNFPGSIKKERRPKVYADRSIGPVLEPEEKNVPNIKLSRHNKYVGDIFQKKVVLRHVSGEAPTGGSLPLIIKSDTDIIDATAAKKDKPDEQIEVIGDEFEMANLHVRGGRHRKKSVSRGPVPFNTFLGNTELNLADGFVSEGEKVRAVADIQQGAYFYISYGKNDGFPLEEVSTMDLNDNRAIIQMDSTSGDFQSTKPFPESYNAMDTVKSNAFISESVSVTSLASSVLTGFNVPGFVIKILVDGVLTSFIKVLNEKEDSTTGILTTIEYKDFQFNPVNGEMFNLKAWTGRTISEDTVNTGHLDHIGGSNQFSPFKLLNDSGFGFKTFVDENATYTNRKVGRRLEFRVRLNISASILTGELTQNQVLGEIMYGHDDPIDKGVLRNIVVRVDEGMSGGGK